MKLYRLVIVLTLLLGAAGSAAAGYFCITPRHALLPTLETYPQTAASWWKWAASQTAADNPILDETGEHCASGQPAFGVWYLAGHAATVQHVARTCTVPRFRTLVFPVINYLIGWSEGDEPKDRDEAVIRAEARRVADATDLRLTIDGIEVPNLKRFYEESTRIEVTLPADNLLGLPAGTRLDPAYDAGYYVAVSGLLPGKHTLAWGARADELGFSKDVTYELTIE